MDGNPQSNVREFRNRCIIHGGILDAMLASRDWNNQEIADYLGFSPNTVKTYLSRIYVKLNIKKRDETEKSIC